MNMTLCLKNTHQDSLKPQKISKILGDPIDKHDDKAVQRIVIFTIYQNIAMMNTGLILSLCPANERRRYFVTASLIGWAQT